jgi:hypothetical protein
MNRREVLRFLGSAGAAGSIAGLLPDRALVRLIDGFGHELGGRPDVVTPILREFFDPLLLHG